MSTTKKIPVSSSTPSNNPDFNAQLRAALVANGSIPTIQDALQNELQRTGYAKNLHDYVTKLMRSGECTKYDDIMDKVLEETLKHLDDDAVNENGDKKGANASGSGSDAGLRIDDSVKDKGIAVVKKELAKVIDFDGDDDASAGGEN